MSLQALAVANTQRQIEWGGNEKADLAFRALEFAGESGELCEAVKKFLRKQRGIEGNTLSLEAIEDEMGDVIITLSLLATDLGIDLDRTYRRKFNKTSAKYGFKTRMPE
ncbi:MAG: MazG-like family protein [Pseudomonadota bacterium]